MKKAVGILLTLTMVLLTACSGSKNQIVAISREEGSGTRGAFIELFGIEEKDEAGNKVDKTMVDAETTNSTAILMTKVAGNKDTIGYISLGSLNNTVKAVKIDGAAASVENIKNGSYKVSRPFNIATKEGISEQATDFIQYILSSDGQKVVEDKGYIALEAKGAYTGSRPSGKIVVAGSSSVTPVMEALKEAYAAVNPNADIEIQMNDSTTGITSTISGICDIGMASRDLKDTELAKGLIQTIIATDGIAVIVNQDNAIDSLTTKQVKDIYTGEITNWADVA